MVVLHHDALHRALWGAADTAGRSARLDAAVYAQLAVLVALGACCGIEFDKPAAVRLAVAAVSTLVYFRSSALPGKFVRLVLFVSLVMLYGDVALPLLRFAQTKQLPTVGAIRLALSGVFVFKNVVILFALFSRGALQSAKRPAAAVLRRKKLSKAA